MENRVQVLTHARQAWDRLIFFGGGGIPKTNGIHSRDVLLQESERYYFCLFLMPVMQVTTWRMLSTRSTTDQHSKPLSFVFVFCFVLIDSWRHISKNVGSLEENIIWFLIS